MILPLFFLMFMAIFWFGQAFRIYSTLTQAARAGAQAAVTPVCTTCTGTTTPEANAQAAVYASLAAAHVDKNQLVKWSTWTAPVLCPCGSASSSCSSSAKTCNGTVTDVCVQENVQLSYTSQGGAGTCGTSVSMRYKYPYTFTIPLTNLDLGQMLLPGQAEMREESQ